MKTDDVYNKWLAGKQAADVPEGWAESMMQRIDRYKGSKRHARLDVQAWIDRFCACVPARAALVVAGLAVCVTRFVLLCLAVLG